jgi:hypothetical protein
MMPGARTYRIVGVYGVLSRVENGARKRLSSASPGETYS